MQFMEAVVAIFSIFTVFGMPTFLMWLFLSHRRQMKQLEVRKLEAEVELTKANAVQRLPEYVDRDDPADVESFREAQDEVRRAAARSAAMQRQL